MRGRARAGGSVLEGVRRRSEPDRAATSPCEPPFSRSLLTFSLSRPGWPTIKRKGSEKGFQKKKKKKVDCKQAVGFRPLPPARLCSTPFSVSLHLQSKLGGKGREGEASRFTPDPVLLCFVFCFFFAVSFLHTCPAAAVIKAPSVISNAPRSPAAAPPRN